MDRASLSEAEVKRPPYWNSTVCTVTKQSRKRGTSCVPDRERKQGYCRLYRYTSRPNVASAGFTVLRIRQQRYAIHSILRSVTDTGTAAVAASKQSRTLVRCSLETPRLKPSVLPVKYKSVDVYFSSQFKTTASLVRHGLGFCFKSATLDKCITDHRVCMCASVHRIPSDSFGA